METKLLEATVANVTKRSAEGDCPATPAYSVEWLEEAVIALYALTRRSSSAVKVKALADKCSDCPPAGYPTDETRCLPCPRRSSADKAFAELVKVKLLEWRPIGPHGSDVEADTILGEYTLSFDAPSAGGAVNMWVAGADKDLFESFDNTREAKAAAQSDFNTRILSALETPSPSPDAGSDEPVAWASCPGCNGTGDQGGNPSYGACDDCGGEGKIGSVLPLTPSKIPEPSDAEVERVPWRTMDSAPLDGKHCILAVPEPGGFIYNVQGAYQGGQWNAVHRDNVQPLYWMPNFRLPDGWQHVQALLAAKSTGGER